MREFDLGAAIGVALLSFASASAFGQEPQRITGYWEGKGAVWERPIDDAIRQLTRRSDSEFWFVCDGSGSCKGEATTNYSADLTAIKWTIPLPSGGSIEASVAGSSEKTKFTYPIDGTVANGTIQLRASGESSDMVVPNVAFNFVLRAMVNLPSIPPAPGASPQMRIISIPAKGWSPFQGLQAAITKRPHGPLVAAAKSAGDKFSIEWQVQRNPTYDLSDLANELEPLLEARLLAVLEPQLEVTLLARLEPTLEINLAAKLETILEPKLEIDLGPKLELALEPKLEATLEAKLEAKLEAELEAKLKLKLKAELKPEIEVEIKADIEAELLRIIQTTITNQIQAITNQIQVIQQTDTKQDDRISAIEGATLTIHIVDRGTGKPVSLTSIEILGGNATFTQGPSTEEGAFAVRLPKGHYTIHANSGDRRGTASVDLQRDNTVDIQL
jgi:hypothetical protein